MSIKHRQLFLLAFLMMNTACKKKEVSSGLEGDTADFNTATVHGATIPQTQYNKVVASLDASSQVNGADTMVAANGRQDTYPYSAPTTEPNPATIWGTSSSPAYGLQSNDTPYMARCRASGVPIPPPWGDRAWSSKGELPSSRIFALDNQLKTEVFAYESEGGTCVGLPRSSRSTGEIFALGIICQAKNGTACFWDNVDPFTQRKISDPKRIRPELISDGSNLEENCTQCHRGDNVFIVHEDTALSQIPNRDPTSVYQPLGRPNWQNPAGNKNLASDCQSCHTLPALTDAYCSSVLLPSIRGTTGSKTMPPAGEDPEIYRDDIREIEKACAEL